MPKNYYQKYMQDKQKCDLLNILIGKFYQSLSAVFFYKKNHTNNFEQDNLKIFYTVIF
jgi:hypothetical protein